MNKIKAKKIVETFIMKEVKKNLKEDQNPITISNLAEDIFLNHIKPMMDRKSMSKLDREAWIKINKTLLQVQKIFNELERSL